MGTQYSPEKVVWVELYEASEEESELSEPELP